MAKELSPMEFCHWLSFLELKQPIMESKIFLSSSIILWLIIPFFSFGAINPIYKECMQRGYNVSGEYCVFPDSSQCLLEDFNGGKCGQKWMTDDYCIPEGRYVWDNDKCCDGLVAYLPEGMAGQATCQPKQATFFKRIFIDSYIGILLLTFALGVLLLFLKKKKGRLNR